MRITRAGGYASWVTFAQFLALLSIFVLVFPRFGLAAPDDFSDPVKGIAALQSAPGLFTAVNLLDASFGVTALVVVLALRELLGGAAPVRMRLAVLLTSASAALFLAGGIVPIVAFPGLCRPMTTLGIGPSMASARAWCSPRRAPWAWRLLWLGGPISRRAGCQRPSGLCSSSAASLRCASSRRRHS
jgi:hypothetical protein